MHTHRSARNPVLRWLTSRVAWHLEVPTHAIDPAIPLAEMGVDSVRELGLVGDVEAQFMLGLAGALGRKTRAS